MDAQVYQQERKKLSSKLRGSLCLTTLQKQQSYYHLGMWSRAMRAQYYATLAKYALS